MVDCLNDVSEVNDQLKALVSHETPPMLRDTNNVSINGSVCDTEVTFLVDTGANVTAIKADVWRQIFVHHLVFTKHCFQPALRSCGFLRTVCMTTCAIITCQPYYHHCLPSLACQPSCASPAFAVVRRTWDAAIPTNSSLSSQSLPPPLDNAVNNSELFTRWIGKYRGP